MKASVSIMIPLEHKYFGKRGEHVVQENLKCVREGLKSVMSIPHEIITNGAPVAKAKDEVVFAK